MKMQKKVSIFQRLFLMLVTMCIFQSCNKNEAEKQADANIIKGKVSASVNTKACSAKSALLRAVEKENWDIDSFNEVFDLLVTATNMTLSAASRTTTEVFKRIDEVSDAQSVFKLYDSLLERAISQEVTIREYDKRQNWFAELWDVAWRAFLRAQAKQKNNFDYWDKIFRFYQKYTNEISDVERTLAKKPLDTWSREDSKKGGYLHGIRGELKVWIRVMRDFYFPNMSKDYTSEQKNDILRRFREIEKYTITPPHYPGGKARGQ